MTGQVIDLAGRCVHQKCFIHPHDSPLTPAVRLAVAHAVRPTSHRVRHTPPRVRVVRLKPKREVGDRVAQRELSVVESAL